MTPKTITHGLVSPATGSPLIPNVREVTGCTIDAVNETTVTISGTLNAAYEVTLKLDRFKFEAS